MEHTRILDISMLNLRPVNIATGVAAFIPLRLTSHLLPHSSHHARTKDATTASFRGGAVSFCVVVGVFSNRGY